MSFYEHWLRPHLFRMDPESAHERTVAALELAGRIPGASSLLSVLYSYGDPALETTVAGLRFPNPVGLAAGYDKDCRLAGILPSLGFGFIEVGTVTPRPQPGNPKPRLFRIPEAEAIINRLGFNNCGAAEAARRLERLADHHPVPVGINLGMNADTPVEKAHNDYLEAFNELKAHGDYFAVNVSSPNTRGLRELQERLKLDRILTVLRDANKERKPIFVKIAPDLDAEQLAGLVPLLAQQADGIIVANTTVAREGLPENWADVRGGLSGAPLRNRSTELIAQVYRMTRGKLPIIGVGGIFSAEDAHQKIRAGASLVQVYAGLVYRGPGLAREINEGLVRLLGDHGLGSIAAAVGKNHEDIQENTEVPVAVKSDKSAEG